VPIVDSTTCQPTRVAVAVLAAGHGTRMNSSTPKHLHRVAGVPIVERVIRAGLVIEPETLVAVVSPSLVDLPDRLSMHNQFATVVQAKPEGTAAAVRCALEAIEPVDLLVSLLGDSPLLTGEVVRDLVDGARSSGARVTILTCHLPDAETYGRIERDEHGRMTRIVEFKTDVPEHRHGPTEINSGIMVLDAAWAKKALQRIELSPQAGEFLLTDIVEVAIAEHKAGEPWPVGTVTAAPDVAMGINDRNQLAQADAVIREQARRRLLAAGVTLIGAETIFIDETVEIGADTTVYPYSLISGHTTIGRGCEIGPNAVLRDATLGERVRVESSTVTSSSIEHGATVGPYAHVRGGSSIGAGAHVGTSTELKNASLGAGAKAGHFSYIGDATVGAHSNIGAGTVTANYDGTTKHRTDIGERVFVGSDSIIVAPITIGHDARTGAGAVVTRNVEPGATVVGVPARPMVRRGREHPDEG
jgi:bifunctional UDP-N-acetylglucosamine pyrophosphorylase/glucosamine-1-phosphate N-acetyltransferase